MSGTKRKQDLSLAARRDGGGAAASETLLERRSGEFDDLDDLLGEIGSALDAPAALDPDPLDEPSASGSQSVTDDHDDILGELTSAEKAAAAADFDDILGEIASARDVRPFDDLGDILDEIAEPPAVECDSDLDDILNDVSAPLAVCEPAAAGASPASDEDHDPAYGEAAEADPGQKNDERSRIALRRFAAILRKVPVLVAMPNLQGTREISRKSFMGGIAAIVLLGVVSIGQAAVLLTRPAAASAGHKHQPAPRLVAALPVDYAKVDLTLYRNKSRSLREGGREILRNPAVKEAILELASGERIYEEIRSMAQQSAATDLVKIGAGRLVISSCNTSTCGNKSFRLVYDLREETASVCITEQYLDGSYLTYRYSETGYREVPHCSA